MMNDAFAEYELAVQQGIPVPNTDMGREFQLRYNRRSGAMHEFGQAFEM